ncbi:hypothetical protein BO94DRAFT_583244 [Aspergillus sclerotioniger CBS 115572]|uniref:Uncharacterized protein n=1 Tax=Aspergillus sclerotioniger CBS 115572 TaxID=1450535 RepID=A0A317X5V2_9EURO|nr:hypothetical protein BO94DRAFT_583244 [Aspergillus sclerotioniger CBS 115572]PWY93002.1 hypothetical protein BO94DRAFT_583244 [Aspergillus sclerotioniger CBS 115572]
MSRVSSRGSDLEMCHGGATTTLNGYEVRKRRTSGSSSDEGNQTFDGFINEDYRVGAMDLCALPVQTIGVSRANYLYSRLCSPESPVKRAIESILKSHNIVRRWNDFERAICQRGDHEDNTPQRCAVLVVGCYRQIEDRKSTPTILILLNVASTRNWENTWKIEIQIRTDFKLPDVAVDISKDVIYRSGHWVGDLDERSCQDPVRPRSNMGINLEDRVAGTFSGYVELKSLNWRQFGLTCFNCVLPTREKSALELKASE